MVGATPHLMEGRSLILPPSTLTIISAGLGSNLQRKDNQYVHLTFPM